MRGARTPIINNPDKTIIIGYERTPTTLSIPVLALSIVLFFVVVVVACCFGFCSWSGFFYLMFFLSLPARFQPPGAYLSA